MAIYMIFTSWFKYWTEDTVYQFKIKSNNIKAIFPASGGRAEMIVRGAFQSMGLSVDFIQRKLNLKTNKVLVKPSFNKSEWVTDWSVLIISCLQVKYPLN